MHETKREIIHTLRYKPGSRFSDLKSDGIDSNKLSYHLNRLEKQDLIKNIDSRYFLTDEAKKQLNFLTDDTAEIRKHPVVVVALLPIRGNKILLQERLKEPWYGYWLYVSGKVEFGETFDEAIARELFEETGLRGKSSFVGMVSSISKQNEKTAYHVHMYCYRITDISGKLKADVKEGKNKWFTLSDLPRDKMHPLDYIIFTKKDDKPWLLEQDEVFDGNDLVDMNFNNMLHQK